MPHLQNKAAVPELPSISSQDKRREQTSKRSAVRDENILIFQIASLGDTVVSVPVYREIARRHPNAKRYLLTNCPAGKMVPAESILGPIDLITGTIEYPMPLRGFQNIWRLFKTLTRLRPQQLYYLTAETKTLNLIRHYAFFRVCGIPVIRGMPWARDLRRPRKLEYGLMWESEASRMMRSIGAKSEPTPPLDADRSLDLSRAERSKALAALSETANLHPFIAISVGGKVPVNDWGDANWTHFLSSLSRQRPDLGIVFVGSTDEKARNDRLAESWSGPKYNACGLFSPRETAAILERALLFVGHDTGTLHLAAAAGTRVVGVFSARNFPGKWFSDRPADKFFYQPVDCMGCELVAIHDCPFGRKCILSIDPADVLATTREMLE